MCMERAEINESQEEATCVADVDAEGDTQSCRGDKMRIRQRSIPVSPLRYRGSYLVRRGGGGGGGGGAEDSGHLNDHRGIEVPCAMGAISSWSPNQDNEPTRGAELVSRVPLHIPCSL